ncbi:hypothetical protein OUZ56_030213 [Daphnia magna]|uniref:Uncharacterized protein n=1 Tax=Daphnia magna TaxID=35525 RepID=A0ABQ9ZQM2_9CRUS|nr:hypothetical protein OUZ56_030213 [Daphnia magna]
MYSTSDPDICRTSDGLPCVMWEYGKKLRGNLISDWEDEDDDGDDGQNEDLDHSFEEIASDQDPCDLELVDDEGNMRLFQKRTLCWFLEEQTRKMSSDRILRVRQLMSFPDSRKLVVKSVEKRPIVRIGDWCIFKTLPGPQREYLFLLGRDLQFNSFADSKQKSIYEWQSSSEKKK